MKTRTLINSGRQPVDLGDELGRGGEGTVYHVLGRGDVVAKVYHQPPDTERQRKLQVMIRQANPQLTSQCAWPQDVLRDPNTGGIVGLLMPKVSGFLPLHTCYNPEERMKTLPGWLFHHLIHVACNLAAAFDTVHTAQAVIGDVNPSGVKVCPTSGVVRLIDCDSFQLRDGSGWLRCTVGSPHYTPPELIGARLGEVVRRVEHDAFGLAVLVFQLLFLGRHPFAGKPRVAAHIPIETAIRERCYAFASPTQRTKLDPPPGVPHPRELTPTLAELFERAFMTIDHRPMPMEWVQALSALLDKQALVQCGTTSHVYLRGTPTCPWCAISRVTGGIDYFPAPLPDDATLYRPVAEFEQLCRELEDLLAAMRQPLAVPQPGKLGVVRTGRPWPAEADPTRLGPPPVAPPKPEPPKLLPLPEVPTFVPPPDPPEPTYTPLPPEPPPFEFKPSRPRPTPPVLPELPVLVLPEPPKEPRLELLTRYSTMPYSEKLARKYANRSFHGSWEGLAWWLSLGGVVALAGALWVVSAWPALAVPLAGLAGVFGVSFVALETVRRRWVTEQMREMQGRWLEVLAEKSSVWPRRRRRAVAALHAELRAKARYEEELHRHRATCEQRRVEFEREDLRVRQRRAELQAEYERERVQWEAEARREREEQLREYEKVKERMLSERRRVSKANAKRHSEWREACREQREWAQAEHAQKCREVNDERRRVEQQNNEALSAYEQALATWQEQVDAEKRYLAKREEVRSRYDAECSRRRSNWSNAMDAYEKQKREFAMKVAGLAQRRDDLKKEVDSLQIKWCHQVAQLDQKLETQPAFRGALQQHLRGVKVSGAIGGGLTRHWVSVLHGAGIRTAWEVNAEALSRVHGFRTGKKRQRLLEWRAELEVAFKRKWAAGDGKAVFREINGEFRPVLSGCLQNVRQLKAKATQLRDGYDLLRKQGQEKLLNLAADIEQAEADLKAVPPWP